MLGRSALLAATNSENYGNWLGNYSDVSLLLRNGTPLLIPLDESPTPKTITAVDNASVTTIVAKWNQGSGGSSLAFDGTADYLQTPSTSDLSAWSTDFTIEGWFFANILANPATCCTNSTSNSDGMTGMYIYGNGRIAIGRIGINEITSAAGVFTSGVWTHIAWVRNGNTVFIYANGILVASGGTTVLETTTTRPLTIGRLFQSGSPSYWNGYIDDFRITKGIARYVEGTGANAGKMVFAGTNNLALPTTELPANIIDDPSYNSVSLLLRGNGTQSGALVPFDESPTPKVIFAAGNAGISTTIFQYGTGSMAFDGSGDYFDFTDSTNALDLGGTNATLEGWFRINTGGSGLKIIMGKGGGIVDWVLTGGWLYHLQYDYSIQRIVFAYNNGGGPTGVTSISGGSQPPGTDWYHIAVVTNTSNGITLFVNGISVATSTNAISKPTTRTLVRIGSDFVGSFFNGYIDDLRHTRVARYTSNFTPPTAELPNF